MTNHSNHDEQNRIDLELETIYYNFKHNFYRIEKAHKRLRKKPGNFSFKLEWNKESGGKTSYEVPDKQTAIEFAVSASPFLLPNSYLYIDNLLNKFQQLSTYPEHKEYFKKVIEYLLNVRKGQFPVIINNQRLNAEKIFVDIARNVLFANDIEAMAYLKELQKEPILGNIKWELYYGYCLDVYNILENIDAYLNANKIQPPTIERKEICIYCKTREGSFKNVEHIIPESIGNESLFLPRGYVCDECNNKMSEVEQIFVNSLPISLLRIFTNGIGKKGKFPLARFSNVHFYKTSTNSITVIGQAGENSIPKAIEQSDGSYKIKMPEIKQRIDHHAIARVLFKIGLGIIAIDRGQEEALNSKYDKAREYILNGGNFHNRLVFFKNVHPHNGSKIRGLIDNNKGTLILFDLLGAKYLINLEPEPVIELNNNLLKHSYIYDLWSEEPGPHHGLFEKM